jgi:hypothetical protein
LSVAGAGEETFGRGYGGAGTCAERSQFAVRDLPGSGGVVFREFIPTGDNDLNWGCG